MDLSITMYLRPSLAAADSPRMVNVFSFQRPAKLRSSREIYSAGHAGTRGAGALIGAGRTPEWACGTLGRSPGRSSGVFAGRFACHFRYGRFVSCHGVGAEYCRCLRWPCRKRSEAVSGQSDPREGSGPIGAPDSGDDVSIWHGPSPRAASPIKARAVPPPLSGSFSFSASLLASSTPPRPASCCPDSASSSPPT